MFINVPKIEEFVKKLAVFYESQNANFHNFGKLFGMKDKERHKTPINFGRIESQISDLKKIPY